MGAAESTHLEEKFYGFRIYKLVEGGPLHNAGVKELEDFIIPPQEVYSQKIPFYSYIKENEGKKVKLNVYSILRRYFYTLEITPNTQWASDLNLKDGGLLGASVRYENWNSSCNNLLRVIKVKENSLAKKIGLIPKEDYIIALRPEGKDILTLNKDTSDPLTLFSKIISENLDNIVDFYVYNYKTGSKIVRALIEPKEDGILGCDVAYGKLHEFPKLVNNKFDDESGLSDVEQIDSDVSKISITSPINSQNKNISEIEISPNVNKKDITIASSVGDIDEANFNSHDEDDILVEEHNKLNEEGKLKGSNN